MIVCLVAVAVGGEGQGRCGLFRLQLLWCDALNLAMCRSYDTFEGDALLYGGRFRHSEASMEVAFDRFRNHCMYLHCCWRSFEMTTGAASTQSCVPTPTRISASVA